MSTLGIKFCGNCNPQINTVKLLRYLESELPKDRFTSWEDKQKDLLIILNGCFTGCAERPLFEGPIVTISGFRVESRYMDTKAENYQQEGKNDLILKVINKIRKSAGIFGAHWTIMNAQGGFEMDKPVVAAIKFKEAYNSLKEVIELCEGLKDFRFTDKILIKPNLVDWDFDLPYPPFGVVTTSALVSALVRILAEAGYTNLTIGEGSLPVPKSKTRAIFKTLGYEKLKEKYGIRLVDFNEEEFVPVDLGDFKLSVAKEALEADKIINLPVLKTHNQCKLSLGIKNLKGCLNRKSKIFCHHKDIDLDFTFPKLLKKLPVALTIIDGIFTLEKGPSPTGKAYRKDMLVASRDACACDIVGADLIGYTAESVPHLKYAADVYGRSASLEDIEIKGEDIAGHRSFVDYDWEWTDENTGPVGFAKRGITGLAIRKYDKSLCTGCSMAYNPMLILFMSAFKGEPFEQVEVLTGKKQVASSGFEKTVLFGKCICDLNQGNPNIKKSVKIRSCPPDLRKFEEILRQEGINCDYSEYVKYRHYLFNRYKEKKEFDLGLFFLKD